MKIKPWMSLVLCEGEGAGAGAGAGAGSGAAAPAGGLAAAAAAAAASAAGADNGAGAGAGAGAPAGDGGAQAYYPEGLAESFRGKSDKETIDKLAEHMGKLPRPPAEAKAYEFKPSEKLAPFFGREQDNKVLDAFRDTALKHGLAQTQFDGVINDFYGQLMEQGLLQPPIVIETEFRKLGGTAGDPATQESKGKQRILELAGNVDALAAAKHFSADQAAAIKGMTQNADQVIAMERLLSLIPGAQGPSNGGQPGRVGAVTKADVEKRMQQAEYTWGDPKFSQSFYEETQRLWQQVAGT